MPGQKETEGGREAVAVNLIPVVAWVWRRGWIQTAWRKVRRAKTKEARKP